MKNKACNEVGITSKIIKLSENVSTENVLLLLICLILTKIFMVF